MSKNGFIYILECSNGKYYTRSTVDLERRIEQHQRGEGANFIRKYLPVKLVYFEKYDRIDSAFYREKQVQGWSRKKKEALINNENDKLPKLAASLWGDSVLMLQLDWRCFDKLNNLFAMQLVEM